MYQQNLFKLEGGDYDLRFNYNLRLPFLNQWKEKRKNEAGPGILTRDLWL